MTGNEMHHTYLTKKYVSSEKKSAILTFKTGIARTTHRRLYSINEEVIMEYYFLSTIVHGVC
jgi:hypothetical protein